MKGSRMYCKAGNAVRSSFVALFVVLFISPGVNADHRPHAGMLRCPDVSATHIVFAYAGDLWLVPREGGMALPLASPPGSKSFPRFSPDGQTIAFVGDYDGNRDIYTIPVAGGVPQRVTHHPTDEALCGWTPDGRLLFSASGYQDFMFLDQLLTVAPAGGLPQELPIPYGSDGAISPDGTWLAYTPYSSYDHTWKRYLGGMAGDIWLFNLRDHSAKRVTDWAGTDSQPMWQGQTLYYASDAGPDHRLNIWRCEPLGTGTKPEQVTQFDRFDVKWPAIGPGPAGDGEIVFQCGPDLYLLGLKPAGSSGGSWKDRCHVVDVIVPGDRRHLRPQRVDVRKHIENWDISATGQRGVFEARGDIWTVPAHKGSPRDLTRTSGVAERDPAWSPDGHWIAYLSDRTGEYELCIMQSDGKAPARQLTGNGAAEGRATEPRQTFRYSPTWSPDSKHIAFTDKTGALYICTLGEEAEGEAQSAETKLVDTDPWAARPEMSWSHDSNWLAYTRTQDNNQTAIWVFDVPTGEKHQLTSGMFRDTCPTFDRAGKYFFFASNRRFRSPVYEDVGSTFVYVNTDTLVVVPLQDDVGSPWAPKSDEETWTHGEEAEADEQEMEEMSGDEDEQVEDEGIDESGGSWTSEDEDADDVAEIDIDEDENPEGEKPLVIDLDGFEQRAILLPVKPGAFTNLAVDATGKLIYVRNARPGTGEKPSIKIFDLSADEDEHDADDEAQETEQSAPPKHAAGSTLPSWLRGLAARWLALPPAGSSTSARKPAADDEAEDKDKKKGEQTVLEGVGEFRISADGKKLLVHKGDTFAVVKAAAGQNLERPMSLDGMTAVIDPREEWRQLFIEAWRIERDFFYDPHMHGVDWPAIRDQYIKMLDDCVSRADVGAVIREVLGELNVGHAYYWGGDGEDVPGVSVGLLGADLELGEEQDPMGGKTCQAYRIKTILTGGPWDIDARGPLGQPGVDVEPGDYLLAVNGIPIDVTQDPWAAFQGLAGKVVTLTVGDNPCLLTQTPESAPGDEADGDAEETGPHDVVVKLLDSAQDAALRYRFWVERNRAYVEEKTAGKVGYIHVPDTGANGQNELFRQFYGQRHKAALIIDERWNGGGQMPTRFIELLNRPTVCYWATRDGRPEPTPPDAHAGPKCMLINGLAGSGGDMFPYLFRQAGLGKLIGTRTWGGLIGIGGNPNLIDGTVVTAPNFAFYQTDGSWAVEGHGVDPDIEVIDDPARMTDGGDPQLDKAIEHMLDEIEQHPHVPVPVPAYPDRSGMGPDQPVPARK